MLIGLFLIISLLFLDSSEFLRILIWKFLLRLPHNEEQYSQLLSRGIHPAFAALSERYPVKDGRLLRQLQQYVPFVMRVCVLRCSSFSNAASHTHNRLLSCLAHWSPVFAELPYLPALVFPFIKVASQDPVLRFEIVVTLLSTLAACL